MRDRVFAIPSPLLLSSKVSPWAILQIQCVTGTAQVEAFQEAMKLYGLGNHEPQFHRSLPQLVDPIELAANDNLFEKVLTHTKQKGVKVLLVILPSNNAKLYAKLYGRLKFWADCKVGMYSS